MPKTRPPYAPEFRRQMVDLVRAGRDPADPADRTGARCAGDGRRPAATPRRDPPFRPGLPTQVQLVVATPLCADRSTSSRASAGVLQPSVLRGLPLSAAATAARSSALCALR